MARITFSIMLAALLCASSFAQESRKEGNSDSRGEAKAGERARMSEKEKYRNQRRVEVKDPAGFAKPEKAVFSGPQPGEKLPPFTATGLQGDLKGKEFDPVAIAGGKPQLLMFQDENGVGIRGLFGLAAQLSRIAEKSDAGLHASTIFLGDDPSQISAFAGRFADRLGETFVMGISADGRDGPGNYGLNRNVAMTVLVARNGVVTHNFVLPQSMLYPDPYVLGAIAEVIGEKPAAVANWLNEEAPEGTQMQGGTRDALAARQAAFRKRLGELVEANKLTREEAGELYEIAFTDQTR